MTYTIQAETSNVQLKAHHRQLIPWKEPPSYIKGLPCFDDLLAEDQDDNPGELDTSSECIGLNLTASDSSIGCPGPVDFQSSSSEVDPDSEDSAMVCTALPQSDVNLNDSLNSTSSSDIFGRVKSTLLPNQCYRLTDSDWYELDSDSSTSANEFPKELIPNVETHESVLPVSGAILSSGGSGVVLSMLNETWDLSSIDEPGQPEPDFGVTSPAPDTSYGSRIGSALNSIIQQTTEALNDVMTSRSESSPASFVGFRVEEDASASSPGLLQRL